MVNVNFNLEQGFGKAKKCWYMMSVIEAIAHCGGKTSDELLNELEGYEPNEKVDRIRTTDGRIITVDEPKNESATSFSEQKRYRFNLRKK